MKVGLLSEIINEIKEIFAKRWGIKQNPTTGFFSFPIDIIYNGQEFMVISVTSYSYFNDSRNINDHHFEIEIKGRVCYIQKKSKSIFVDLNNLIKYFIERYHYNEFEALLEKVRKNAEFDDLLESL